MPTPKTAILHIVEEARQNGRQVGDVRDQTGDLLSLEEEGEPWLLLLFLSSGVTRIS